MAQFLQMPPHPLDGIFEKLKRSEENILNLQSEIEAFFKREPFHLIPDPVEEREDWQKAVNHFKNLEIPKRFSVLAGEIIHHLRSCLDHIVWHFSTPDARRDFANVIEFPVFALRPDARRSSTFERKIQGITKPTVRALIHKLQPYHKGIDAHDDPLCIVHDMDRFDKHRELSVVIGCVSIAFHTGHIAPELHAKMVRYKTQKSIPPADMIAIGEAIRQQGNATPQIAFAKFGNRETEAIIPCLIQLLDATRNIVELFSNEI